MTSVQAAAANLPLTYLFVPGNRADRFDKALGSQAGAVIVDLEDAVAPDDKAAARASVAAWYTASAVQSKRILLRINDESTPWFDEDIALVASVGLLLLGAGLLQRRASNSGDTL